MSFAYYLSARDIVNHRFVLAVVESIYWKNDEI